MRRVFYWYIPLGVAIVAAALFAAGFYSFLHGDLGTPVDEAPLGRASTVARPQPSSAVAPIILGDSVARGTGDTAGLGIGGRLDQELRRRNIIATRTVNVAVNGSRTTNLIEQLKSRNVRTLLAQSNVVIISIGGNDLGVVADLRNGPPQAPETVMGAVLERMSAIVQDVRRASPRARVFLVGLYNPYASSPAGARLTPLVNRWNARLIERFSDDPQVTVVQTIDIFLGHNRLAYDRFHPGDEGYALIARRIADAI